MTMRRAPTFGISIVPAAEDLAQAIDLVRRADALGLDVVGVQDHPYQRRFVDTLALLGHLLDRTARITVFPDVANLPLRPPAVLAKHAATLDLLSGGRFELGLGAGAFWDGVERMGGPRRSPGEAVDALAEALDVIRDVWADRHPGPAHPMGIWLGAYKPRMLRLTGEKADGWVPSLMRGVGPAQLGELDGAVTEAAQRAGRDPGDVRRIWNIPVPAVDSEDPAAQLANWAERYGVDTFVLWPSGEDQIGQVERLGEEIAPAVRERLGVRA